MNWFFPLFFVLALCLPNASHGDAVIFSGQDVKALKYNLDLFGRSKVMGLAADPSSGAGLVAPLGSIGMDYLTGSVYIKSGAGATNWSVLCGATQACALTNKTIDADLNTITNIENADIKAGAAIDASKIANGTVSSTEFQYIGGLTSDAQTQLDAKVPKSDYTSGTVLVGTGAGTYGNVSATDQATNNGNSTSETLVRRSTEGSAEFNQLRAMNGTVAQSIDGRILYSSAGSSVMSYANFLGDFFTPIRFTSSTGSWGVTLQASTGSSGAYTLTMPVDDGTANQVPQTDGSGVLSWVDATDQSTAAATVVRRDSSGYVELARIKNSAGTDVYRTDNATIRNGSGNLMIDHSGARPISYGSVIANTTAATASNVTLDSRNNTTEAGTNYTMLLPQANGVGAIMNDGSGRLHVGNPQSSFNYIENSGWEPTGTNDWTASGGTYTRTTTAANLGSGLGAGGWNSSGAAQTLTSDAIAIYAGAYGQNGVVSCKFQTPSGTATHKLQAYDGTNVLAEATITSATTYPRTNVNFIFPSSGNIQARIVSVAADEPQIYIDDCFLGLAEGFNVAQVSQASLIGKVTFVGATNCTRESTSVGAYANIAFDNDCDAATVSSSSGEVLAPSTEIPGFRLNAVAGAKYVITFGATMQVRDSAAAGTVYMRLSDGTVSSADHGCSLEVSAGSVNCPLAIAWTYEPTTTGTVTIQAQAYVTSATGTGAILNAESTRQNISFSVMKFPSTAETAIAANQAPQWGLVKYTGTTNCNWASSSAGFTVYGADADCTNRSASGGASLPGTLIPAMTFGTLPAGTYKVTAFGAFVQTASTTSNPRCNFQIWDGTSSGGNQRNGQTSTGNIAFQTTLSGVFTYTSPQSNLTFQVRSDREAGDGSCDVAVGVAGVDFSIMLEPITQSLAAPILVGSVTSNSAGAERQERAVVVCSASSSITSQSGTWLTAIGNRSSGACALTIATGMFSARPTCTVQAEGTSTTNIIYPKVSGFSATGFTITGVEQASGTTAATTGDITYNIHCQGPR
jgi:hypothetical protein